MVIEFARSNTAITHARINHRPNIPKCSFTRLLVKLAPLIAVNTGSY
jgi:hypothetical protein